MGVYIKGMEMPKSCVECPLREGIGCNAFNTVKPKTLMSDKRVAFCPLVEVPEPHGRLIDADFEEKHYASMTINPTPDVTPQDYMHSGYTAMAFQMAKTVIEAEGE